MVVVTQVTEILQCIKNRISLLHSSKKPLGSSKSNLYHEMAGKKNKMENVTDAKIKNPAGKKPKVFFLVRNRLTFDKHNAGSGKGEFKGRLAHWHQPMQTHTVIQ